MSDINSWTKTEVAYKLPGQAWKRATPKTKSAYTKLIAKLVGQGADIRTREAI